jgi:hypothetical protein
MTPRSFTHETVVRASGDQTSANLGDAVAVLQMRSGIYYGLDGAGNDIWQMLQEPIDVGSIRDRLLEIYDVEPERCEQDLVAFLEALETEGLVTTVEP